jgi:hypothetical protein
MTQATYCFPESKLYSHSNSFGKKTRAGLRARARARAITLPGAQTRVEARGESTVEVGFSTRTPPVRKGKEARVGA